MTKIMSSVLLTSLLLIGTSSTTFADETNNKEKFGAFVFTPSTADGTIDGYKLDGGGMLGLLFGDKKLFSDSLGLYGGFDMSYNTIDETESSDAIYGYRIFSVGVTYNPFDSLTLLAGIGTSWEFGEKVSYGTHYKTKDDKTELNLQAGVIYDITDSFGALLKYDSASSSIGGGIVWNF